MGSTNPPKQPAIGLNEDKSGAALHMLLGRELFFWFVIFALSLTAKADDSIGPQPTDCPQCGFWHLSNSSMAGLIGEIMIIDKSNISIPGCGDFAYKVESSTSAAETNGHRNDKLTLTLRQRKTSFLCNNQANLSWIMSVSISGHFHEGGFGEFSLRRAKENTDFLSMEGWNSEKEDPCDAGSGRGSVACMKIDSARLYKALSMEADNAYAIILSEKKTRRNKIPSFNPARFSAEALSFCSLREKDSGGGSWPYAWALTCQNNLLQEKLTKFREWCACVERRKNGETACHFPNEYFDRSISPEH